MARIPNTRQFRLADVITNTDFQNTLKEGGVIPKNYFSGDELIRQDDMVLRDHVHGLDYVINCGYDLRGYPVLLIVRRAKEGSTKAKSLYVAAGCRRFKSLKTAVSWWSGKHPYLHTKSRRQTSRFILGMLKQGLVRLEFDTGIKVEWPKL